MSNDCRPDPTPNQDQPAHPFSHDTFPCWTGLTKREWFAGLAMHALIACPKLVVTTEGDSVSKNAVAYADALIAALKEKP